MKWPSVRLDAVGNIVTGSTPPTADRSYYGHEVMFVSPADLGATKYIRRSAKMLSAKGFARCRRIPSGSTLFVCIGSTIGKIGLAGEDLATNQQINSIVPNGRVDSEFLYYAAATLSSQVQNQAGEQAVPIVSKSRFAEFEIPLPALAEQRKIATALRDADDLVASLECLITKKQAIKQGMMQELLTGRTRLPGFTRNWVSGTFEDLASPVKERTLPALVSPDTPLVELEQIEAATGRLLARSTVTTATSLKTRFSVGDVLFGKLRAYLRKFWIADTSGLCTTEIWAFRSKPGVSGEFVRFVVETDGFIEVASGAYGTHMPRSDWRTVRRYELLIPEPEEQKAIASVLMDADREIELLRARLAKGRDIKQGMMQELLTGRARLPVSETVA